MSVIQELIEAIFFLCIPTLSIPQKFLTVFIQGQ